MSGRQQNRYCKKETIDNFDKKSISYFAKKACPNGDVKRGFATSDVGYDRRVAVNINNRNTVEVRMFKATNDRNNLLRKLEFCESLVKFVRSHSTKELTPYHYVEFILKGANKKEYQNIVRWLAAKNFISHERKKIPNGTRLVDIYSKNLLQKPITANVRS
jgi:intergrase/recombinase